MDTAEMNLILKNMDLVVLCEEAVADFYQDCAETWPHEREFWSDLAADGLADTTRLQLMQHRARDSARAAGSIRVFSPATLTTFLAWVESSRARVRSGKIDLRGAVALARDLERSPIVSEHYQLTHKTDPALADYLLSFATDYGKHAQSIEARLGRSLTTAPQA